MKLGKAFRKLGPHLALQVFKRNEAFNAIPFSEWLIASEVALNDEVAKQFGPVAPHSPNYTVAKEVIAQLCAKAKTFDEHLATLDALGHCNIVCVWHEKPDPRHAEYEMLTDEASSFTQCVVAYSRIQRFAGKSVGYPCPTEERGDVLRGILLERAFQLADSFDGWLWVARESDLASRRWVEAMRHMEEFAAHVDQWAMYYAQATRTQWRVPDIDASYAEKALQKLAELVAE